MRVLWIILLFWATAPILRGDDAPVQLPVEYRARNYNNHCVWCCLQTMAKHQGITPLVEIIKEIDKDPRKQLNAGAYFEEVSQLLQKREIAHYFQPRSSYDLTEVRKALTKGVGVMVSLNNQGVAYNHAVVLVRYDQDRVGYYDPDHPQKITETSRTAFHRRWNGQALFLDYLVPQRPALPSEQPRLLVADLKR